MSIQDISQKEMLVKIMKLVINSGVCPETSPKEWAKLILFSHCHGFLYANSDLTTVVCAYRSHSNTHSLEMPNFEDSDAPHLHVVYAASESSDRNSLLKLMRMYLKTNKVKDITYYRRNSDTDFKKLTVKGN